MKIMFAVRGNYLGKENTVITKCIITYISIYVYIYKYKKY